MTASLSTHTVAMVAAASGVDTALKSGENACNQWARFCSKRLMGNKPSLTLDDVSATLVAACLAVATPKQRKEIGSIGTLAKHGFATAYGWYRMLVRIHAANMLPQLAEPKSSLWALGKAAPSTQSPSKRKAKGKATKGKGKAETAPETAPQATPSATPSAVMGWADVRAFLIAQRKSARGGTKGLFASEADISVCVAEIGNIVGAMERARKAKAASAAKAKTVGTIKKAARKAA